VADDLTRRPGVEQVDMTPKEAGQFLAQVAQATARQSQDWDNFADICRSLIKQALAAGKAALRPIETAPRDGTSILLLTADFGFVEGWWDDGVTNFYKSQVGWASYEPDPAKQRGDWVSDFIIGDDPKEGRLFCGATPQYWMPRPDTSHCVCRDGYPLYPERRYPNGLAVRTDAHQRAHEERERAAGKAGTER
jgi:hypothetical protein